MRLLNDLVREEYLNPTRGDCHLLMSSQTYAALGPPTTSLTDVVRQRDLWARMTELRIVFDGTVPFNRWRLVKNHDPFEVVEEGQAMPDA